MHFIHKIWQVFGSIDTFWCIIGFVRSMPFLFEVKDVNNGFVSRNQKKLLMTLKIIVETRFNEIYKAIMQHGLPIEHYLGYKLLTILSTIFPTVTLMHFYDLIAIECSSNTPIKAIWVILSACILLLTLNESYIKTAKNAEEIELIISNTGINVLQPQKIIEKLLALSNALYNSYNSTLEALIFDRAMDLESSTAPELAWSRKIKIVDQKFAGVKELNDKIEVLIKDLKGFPKEEDKFIQSTLKDSSIVPDFMSRFCKFYKENPEKDAREKIFLYCYKTVNLKIVSDFITISYRKNPQKLYISPDGMIDKILEFPEDPSDSRIIIQIEDKLKCVLDLQEFEIGMPITLEKTLMPNAETVKDILHSKTDPQPFISFVIMISKKISEKEDPIYKIISHTLNEENVVLKPLPPLDLDQKIMESVIVAKDKQKELFKHAEIHKVLTPGLKAIAEESSEDAEKNAMEKVFSLLQSEEMGNLVALGWKDQENENPLCRDYEEVICLTNAKFPLKRFIIMLIASASITVNEKLSYYYDFYSAISGNSNYPFNLEDLNELVQILFEIHLIPMPLSLIANFVEHVMTDGRIDKITNAYLLSDDANVAEVLSSVHL